MIDVSRIPLIIGLIMVLTFVFLSPKTNSIFAVYRNTQLNNFLHDSIRLGQINLHAFWQFREFFYPGKTELLNSPTFNTINTSKTKRFNQLIVLCNHEQYSRFLSKFTQSETYIVSTDCTADKLLLPDGLIVLNTHADKIIKSGNSILFISIRSIVDFAKVDGFMSFDLKNEQFGNQNLSKKAILISAFEVN